MKEKGNPRKKNEEVPKQEEKIMREGKEEGKSRR